MLLVVRDNGVLTRPLFVREIVSNFEVPREASHEGLLNPYRLTLIQSKLSEKIGNITLLLGSHFTGFPKLCQLEFYLSYRNVKKFSFFPGLYLINDTSVWTESYPEFYTNGKCLTYDPKFESNSGFTFGIGLGLRLVGEAEYDDFAIFLHRKGSRQID